nr:hypothetical protein [Endozoicomonas sp.]
MKSLILHNDGYRQIFLCINAIETEVGWINSSDLTERVPLVQRSVTIDTAPIVYNSRMKEYDDRFYSLTQHGFSHTYRFSFPKQFGSCFVLAEAGFYFSLHESKIACFSCGGVLEPTLCDNFACIQTLHATVYPACLLIDADSGSACNLVAQTLESHPNLYQPPVTEDQIRNEASARQTAIESGDRQGGNLVDERLSREVLAEQRHRDSAILRTRFISLGVVEDHEDIDQAVNACMAQIRLRLTLEQQQALRKLQRKVGEAHTGRIEMAQDFLQILQGMIDSPGIGEIGEVVATTINTLEEQDCQDHTSEMIDRIRTRMLFINIKDGMVNEFNQIEWLKLLCRLKLFFNEQALFRVLSETRVHGKSLIASGESTEIRGFVKNEFAKTICRFPHNQIVLRYGSLGRQHPDVMAKLEFRFKQLVNNRADFINYLADQITTDQGWFDFLKIHDNDFGLVQGKTESSADLLMERYTSEADGHSEQEVIIGANNVVCTRAQLLTEDCEHFIYKKVDDNWSKILLKTSILNAYHKCMSG